MAFVITTCKRAKIDNSKLELNFYFLDKEIEYIFLDIFYDRIKIFATCINSSLSI